MMKKFFILIILLFLSISPCLSRLYTTASESPKQYRREMNKCINRVLYNKITYDNLTLKQMLVNFDKKATEIYYQAMNDKTNNKDSYIAELDKILGTISLYPNAICEEFKLPLQKYDINIMPGCECDSFLYNTYIRDYNIPNAAKLEELIKLRKIIYLKIYNYRQSLFDIN